MSSSPKDMGRAVGRLSSATLTKLFAHDFNDAAEFSQTDEACLAFKCVPCHLLGKIVNRFLSMDAALQSRVLDSANIYICPRAPGIPGRDDLRNEVMRLGWVSVCVRVFDPEVLTCCLLRKQLCHHPTLTRSSSRQRLLLHL
eukprot:3022321-Amphidinium_carterae.1